MIGALFVVGILLVSCGWIFLATVDAMAEKEAGTTDEEE